MSLIDIHVNCPDPASARTIAEAVVTARLAACANIHAPIESAYWWRGKIERTGEVPLVLKTRAALFEQVAAAVRALHPYEVPGIHAVAAVTVTPDYLAWVEAETVEPGLDTPVAPA